MSCVLKVYLSHGSGLKQMDRNGKSDPYVDFTLGVATHRSKTVKRNLSPKWNECFEFSGQFPDLIGHPLMVQVHDADTFTRDDKLGHAEVSLYELLTK